MTKLPDKLLIQIDPEDLAAEMQEVRDYWNAKRGTRKMPPRADIDPFELRRHLPFLSLIEVLPNATDFRFRLLGTEITRQLGRDSTGKTVREVYTTADPELRQWLLDTCASVVARKCPVLGRGTLRAVAKDFIIFETLHLPLSEDGEAVNMLFGRTRFLVPESQDKI
jgi:hypothetical protein